MGLALDLLDLPFLSFSSVTLLVGSSDLLVGSSDLLVGSSDLLVGSSGP